MDDTRVHYVICSVPRCGSTLLGRALAAMGVGVPDEFFNLVQAVDGQGLVERPGLTDCRSEEDLRCYLAMLRDRYTVGGAFGLKTHFAQLASYPFLLHHLPDLLPGTRYIAISRRDVLRQAISCVRANQTQQWASTLPARNEPWFDRAAIDTVMADIAAQARGWKAFFRTHAIRPFHIVYEDFTKDYRGTLTAVLSFLGVRDRTIPSPPLQRQADALTDEWVRRYQAETTSRSPWRFLPPWRSFFNRSSAHKTAG
jgi:LPS sulfotransferase NodH